jgi:Protein of unknown function, DUF547
MMQAVQPMDKRIHFALVCGAKSCPPIRVYMPDELDEGLDAAAAAFCEGATCMLLCQPRVSPTVPPIAGACYCLPLCSGVKTYGMLPAGEVHVDHEGRSVALSMIFKWYADDFGPPDMVREGPCHLRSFPGYTGMQRDAVLWQAVELAASAVLPLHEVLCSCFVGCTLSQCAA